MGGELDEEEWCSPEISDFMETLDNRGSSSRCNHPRMDRFYSNPVRRDLPATGKEWMVVSQKALTHVAHSVTHVSAIQQSSLTNSVTLLTQWHIH